MSEKTTHLSVLISKPIHKRIHYLLTKFLTYLFVQGTDKFETNGATVSVELTRL